MYGTLGGTVQLTSRIFIQIRHILSPFANRPDIFSLPSHFNRNLTAMSASSGQDKHDIENKASIMGHGSNSPPFPPQFQRGVFYFDPF
jgi:hypothetical protein